MNGRQTRTVMGVIPGTEHCPESESGQCSAVDCPRVGHGFGINLAAGPAAVIQLR
jgi:hypothetical protein